MNPVCFPSEKLENLFNELAELGHSLEPKFERLCRWNLAATFEVDGKKYYISTGSRWETFMFQIPVTSNDRARKRTNRTKFLALKSFVIKWVMNYPVTEEIRGEKFFKLKRWFAKHMTGFATISIPNFLVEEFKKDFDLTRSPIHNVTPEISLTVCPSCSHKFVREEEDSTLECPKCGYTYIA